MTWLLANWKLIGIGMLLALLGLQTVRVAELQQAAAERKAVDAESQRLAERAQRTEEQRRVAAVAKRVRDAQPAIQAEARDAAALPDSRLQQPAIQYIRRACANPAPASASAPASDPIMVFADVLGRIEQRSEDLARLAGERGTAGALCERSYDALSQETWLPEPRGNGHQIPRENQIPEPFVKSESIKKSLHTGPSANL